MFSAYGSWGVALGSVHTLCSLLWAEPLRTSVLDLLDSGGLHAGSLGGDGLSVIKVLQTIQTQFNQIIKTLGRKKNFIKKKLNTNKQT